MATIKIHAGDFLAGKEGSYSWGVLQLQTDAAKWLGETISETEIEMIEVATEDNVKKLSGAVGWGVAGGLILGPVGLLAGLLLGGKKKEVTFVARFKDGRKLLATTDNKTFTKLQAAAF